MPDREVEHKADGDVPDLILSCRISPLGPLYDRSGAARRNNVTFLERPPSSAVTSAEALMASRLPKLIAFDLECVLYSSARLQAYIRSYTLWPLWIDTHVGCKLWVLTMGASGQVGFILVANIGFFL